MNRPDWSERQDAGAVQFMILDIISGILTFTDNPKEMGAYLTQQIRELVGAKRVILLQAPATQGDLHRIVSVEPMRQWDSIPCSDLEGLARASRTLERSAFWKREETDPELNGVLERAGIEGLIAIPLRVGKEWTGALFVADLVDAFRAADTGDLLDVLSPVVALVLRNAGFFEVQEEEIKSRTHALVQSETKFRTLAELAPVGIFRLDVEGNFLFANERMRQITGAVSGIPDSEHWTQILQPEDRPMVEVGLGRTLATGEPFRKEFRLLAPSGEWITVIGEAVPERNENGTISGFIGTLTDISERKRMEEAVREAHQFNEQVIDSAQEGIIVYDLDLRYRVWNPFMELLSGIPARDVLGRQPLEVFPFLQATGVLERLNKLLAGEVVDAVDFAYHLPGTGKSGWATDTSSPLCNAKGEIIGVIGMVTDITERKQAEEERQKLDERMSQIQKLEALGVLVAGVAHNINNVLAAIMATASVRERRAVDPKDLEAYRIIDTACKRGRDVVKSLMQFARPTLANQVPLDLHALVTEVRILLENTTGNRITILEAFSGEPLWIHGDAGSISNVLMNLCLNALDAMPNGGTLTFRTAVSERDWAEVSVEDSGDGMTPEVLARVTEPFFTTKPVGKGTGLGLSMTHGVIKAHGGILEITSVPGRGTTVKVRIPRIPVPVEHLSEPPTPPLAPLKVLLVDDDEDVRFLVTRMLKAAGLQVKPVEGGEEALESLRANGLPDLIILDQNMPRMNGIQTMEQIRALYPDVLILISSGQPDIEEWACFKRPNVAVISKPFEMEELLVRLAQIPLKPPSPSDH